MSLSLPSPSDTGRDANLNDSNRRTFLQHLYGPRKFLIVVSLIAVCAIVFAFYAFQQKMEATKQASLAKQKTLEALQQQKNALEERINADSNKEQVLLQRELAIENDKLALQQKELADSVVRQSEKERLEALKQTLVTKQLKLDAEEQRKTILAKTVEADSLKTSVQKQSKIAEEQTKKSYELRELAFSREMANESILLFNENNIDSSRGKALQAFQLNSENNGPHQNNDIYKALNINWSKSINYKNQFGIHQQPVRSIAGVPGSSFIFTADESGVLCESVIKNFSLQKISSSVVDGAIRALAVSPDGRKLAAITSSGNGSIFNISASGISAVMTFKFGGIGKSLVFIDNENFVALSSDGIGQYKLTSNVMLQSLIHRTGMNAVIIGKSGTFYIASGNQLKTYKNWDDLMKESPAMSRNFDNQISSLAVDAGEEYIAAGTNNGFVWISRLRDSNTAPWYRALHLSFVRDLAFSKIDKDKIQLASAGADKTIKLIDVKSALYQNSSEDIITINGHTKWIWKLYYTSDGSLLLSTGEDNKVIAWKPSMYDLYQSLYKK